MIKASQKFREWIKEQEGFSATAYNDAGSPSIGYGTKDKDFLNAKHVTPEMADEQLERDIAKFEKMANSEIKPSVIAKLNQNQMDVILDIYYNLTTSGRRGSINILNRDDETSFDDFHDNIGKLITSKIKDKKTGATSRVVVDALVKRRKAGQKLWRTPLEVQQDIQESIATPQQELQPQVDTSVPTEQKAEIEPTRESPPSGDEAKISLSEDDRLFEDVAKEIATQSQPKNTERNKIKISEDFDLEQAVRDSVEEVETDRQVEQELSEREVQKVGPLFASRTMSEVDALDPDTVDEASRISKKFGASKAEAIALARSPEFKRQETDIDLADVAEEYPVLSKWASDPANFPIMMRNVEGFKMVEKSKSPFMDDLTTILKSSQYDAQRATVMIAMLNDQMDRETAIGLLEKIDFEEGKLPELNSGNEINRISSTFDELEPTFEAFTQSLQKSMEVSPDDWKGLATQRLRTMLLGGLAVKDALLTIASMARTPKDSVLFSAYSLKSSVLGYLLGGIGASIGGAVGVNAGPGGAVLGAQRGFAAFKAVGEGAIGFSSRMLEQMEKKGYGRDYRRFFDDEIEFAESKRVATKYATYLVGLDFLTTRKAGSNTIKSLSSGNKSLISKAGTLAKDVGAGSLREGGSELGARVLPGVTAEGEVIPGDKPSEALVEATREVGGSLGSASVTAGVNILLEKAGRAFKKDGNSSEGFRAKVVEEIALVYEKAQEAVTRRDLFNNLRKAVVEVSNGKNKEQIKEFIRQKLQSDDANAQNQEVRNQMEEDYEFEAEQDIEDGSDEVISNQTELEEEYGAVIADDPRRHEVRISPEVWIEYFQNKGLDPYAEIAKLGEGYELILSSADIDGTDITIPAEDFLTEFAGDERLTSLIKLGDLDFNADEATRDIEVIENEMPGIIGDDEGEGPNFNFPEGEPQEGDPVLRQVELLNNLRGTEEIEVHKKIQSGIRSAMRKTGIDKKSAPLIAELQFQHLRQRSAATGVSISELASRMKFKSEKDLKGSKGQQVLGVLSFATPLEVTLKIAQGVKNPAVLLHELGHSWLYDMVLDFQVLSNIDPEKMSVEQREYKRSMDIAAELLGYDNIGELQNINPLGTKEEQAEWTRIQETFAQTTEDYFFKGKFKNNRVRSLMEGLRRFLKPFAKWIAKAYPQYPPFNIDESVERMFEGILGISDQIDEVLVPMLDDGDYDDALFGAKAPEYQEAKQDARDAAIGKFVGEATIRDFKSRERLVEKAFREFKKEAEEEIKEHPSIKLAEELKALPAGQKISTEDFIRVFGKDAVEQIPRGILSGKKKKGVKVAEILPILDTANEDILFGMLAQAKNKDKLIQDLINEKARRKYPVVKSDEQIHADAVDALVNQGRDKLLRMERDMLIEQRRGVYDNINEKVALPARVQSRLVRKNVEAEATAYALQRTYIGYTSDKFLKESDDHGKESVKRFKRGDIDGALEEKINQIMKFEAYKKSLRISKLINRGKILEKSLQKMSIPKNANNFDADGIAFTKLLIQNFKDGKTLPTVDASKLARVENNGSESVYNQAWGESINQMINKINAELQAQIIRQNAPAGTYLTYVNLLKFLKKTARQQRRLIIGNRNLRLDLVRDSVIDLIKFGVGKDGKRFERSQLPPVRATGTDEGIRRYLKLRGGDTIRMRDALLSLVSNNDEFSNSFLGDVFNPVLTGEANLTLDEEKVFKDLFKEITNQPDKDKSFISKYLEPFAKKIKRDLSKKELPVDTIPIKEYDLNLTKDEIYGMLLHSGSESNLRHLLLGGVKGKLLGELDVETDRVRQEDIDRYWEMIDRLIDEGVVTRADLKAVETVWKFLNERYEAVNDAFEFVHGYRFGRIEGQTVKTKIGSFEGGYFPLSADKAFKGLSQDVRSIVANFGDGNDFRDLFPHTDTSYANSRSGYSPLKLSLDTIPYTIRRVLQMQHLAVPVYNFGKVIGDPAVAQAMEDRMPGVMDSVVVPWVNRTLQQRYSENPEGMKALNFMANKLRKNARVYWFFSNIATPITQLVGLPQAVPQVGFNNLARAIIETGQSPKHYRQLIASKSPRMKARFQAGMKRVLKHFDDIGLNQDIVSKSDDVITNSTFYLIQMAQNQVDVAVWLAAYESKVDKFGERRAVAHADNMVELTQSSSNISNRSSFEQTQEIVRLLLTDLTNIPLTIRGQNVVARNQSVDSDLKTQAKVRSNVYLWSVMIPALLMAGIGTGRSLFYGEDDEEELAQKFMASTARDLIVPFAPVFGPKMAGFAYDMLNYRKGGLRLSPGVSTFGFESAGAYRATSDFLSGIDPKSSDIASLFNFATLMTGIPLSPIGSGVRLREGHKSDRLKKIEQRRRNRQRKRKNR